MKIQIVSRSFLSRIDTNQDRLFYHRLRHRGKTLGLRLARNG
jgi:hypothetical protein